MKKLTCLLLFSIVSTLSIAQSPQLMSYQAVVRDNADALIINASVGMQISILQGSPDGPSQYVETHVPTTNANGLVSIEIGNGSIVSGDLATIDWGNGPFFLRSETDPTGGTNYTISGTSQLLSVPYALYAETSGNAPSLHFPNVEVYSGPCTSDWADVDLSSVVGEDRSLVRLKVLSQAGGGYLMFKAKDDPSDYTFGADTNNTLALGSAPNSMGQMVIYSDTNGFIQMKCSNSISVILTVLHYQN